MIIDAILDRKNGYPYDAREFYDYVRSFEGRQFGTNGHAISYSMDYGENYDIQDSLCEYIDMNNYNPEIKEYINSVDWLKNDDGREW